MLIVLISGNWLTRQGVTL